MGQYNLLLTLFIEFIGTFILLSVIAGIGKAIPIGIALIATIYFGGKYSGGAFNPAVSIMLFADKKLDLVTTVLYCIAQILGGLCALVYIRTANNHESIAHYLKKEL